MLKTLSGIFIFSLISAVLGVPAQAASRIPEGLWQDEAGGYRMALGPCGDKLCGRIVWLRTPFDERGCKVRDLNNPDENLRSRALLGLEILRGFEPSPAQPGLWTGGTLYDPQSGRTYEAVLREQEEGRLWVEEAGGLFSSRIAGWERPTAPNPACPTDLVNPYEAAQWTPMEDWQAVEGRTPLGFWRVENGGARVEVRPCGGKFCGRIVWLRTPFDRNGCQSRGVRQNKMLGMEILRGFEPAPERDGSWKGTIYNPENGKTYKGTLRLDGDEQLLVRGYVGIPLLGVTSAWSRFLPEEQQCP